MKLMYIRLKNPNILSVFPFKNYLISASKMASFRTKRNQNDVPILRVMSNDRLKPGSYRV